MFLRNSWTIIERFQVVSKKGQIQCTLWSSVHLYLVNTNSYGQSFLNCMFEEPFCIQHNLEFKIIIFLILNNRNKCWAIIIVKFALQKKHRFWKLTPSDASMKMITPSHILRAAVTSSEKFTCPVQIKHHWPWSLNRQVLTF